MARELFDTAPSPLYPGEIRVLKHELGYGARVQVKDGFIFFDLTELSHARQSIDCVLEIDLDTKGGKKPSFHQRIDLRSSSAVRSLVTDLNNAYGSKREEKGYNWALILNAAVAELSIAIRKEQKPEYLMGEKFEEPTFLLRPFLQEDSPNIIFAQSEAGKTWLAIHLACSVITGKPFLNFPAPMGKKVLYIDYEDVKKTFVSRLHKVCRGLGVPYDEVAKNFPYYNPAGSIKENAEIVRRMVASEKIDLIIIDAGGDAAGGSPSDEEKVLELFNSLNSIPTTKLLLHHEPKTVVNEAAAFYGSMYWKARSRVGWRLQVESDEGPEKVIKATIQKRSNLPYQDPIYYKVRYDDVSIDADLGDSIPYVSFKVLSEAEMAKDTPVEQAAEDALRSHGELTVNQIAQFVGRDRSVVYRTLVDKMKGKVEQKKSGKGMVWKLK